MKFDFETIIDRHDKDSIAVDVPCGFGPQGETKEGFDRIPMWVADMNFAVVPTVQEELQNRISHPCFGYYQPTKEYYESILKWQKVHNRTEDLEVKHLGYENGVLGGLVTAMNVLCSRGDHVLVHSPTYIGFTKTLENNGYRIVLSELKKDENDVYRMDLEDMEEKIVKNDIRVCVFCSPHNPCGRVWSKEELTSMYEMFEKHHVWVISDEIWSDILLDGNKHHASQLTNEYAKMHTVAMYSLSKTFSLAGLVASYHICYNEALQARLLKEGSLSHYNNMNVLSMHALIGAYKEEGYEWVEELNQVLSHNVNYAYTFIKEHFEGVEVSKPEGTYMLYLDCDEWCEKHNTTLDELMCKGIQYGILWQDGRPFHHPCSIRMNVALPFSRVKEAFERLDTYVFNEE